MLKIAYINVTQESLRSIDSLIYLVKKIKNGDKIPPVTLTKLIEYPNVIFAHDGHTRLTASYLSERDLDESEYIITEYSIADYMNINFDIGYVTPFDIINEVRLRDFYTVKEYFIKNNFTKERIMQNRHLYCKRRNLTGTVNTIKGLANRYANV